MAKRTSVLKNFCQDLPIEKLRRDGGLQMRDDIDQEHVAAMREAYEQTPASVPPIGVLADGKDYWVWDGHHRIEGATAAGFAVIRCKIEQGTFRDAVLRAAGANTDHGLRRSNADKNRAVRRLLDDKAWRKKTDRWIADTCRVSHTFVAGIRQRILQEETPFLEETPPEKPAVAQDQLATLPTELEQPTREGRDGKAYAATKKPAAKELEVLPPELARKVRNTAAAADERQMARLARIAKDDPQLADAVANMLHDCDVFSVDEALQENDQPEPEPQEEASAVLRQLLKEAKSFWRIECPKSASPALGAAVLEAVADEWLNGGWFR